ncbi:MAG TPA: matrixin family metalloprotease [Thermoanaerobaculia bacterium]|nr:matrixin family metalloprotease [Thermoanaerobaculia bacterium]
MTKTFSRRTLVLAAALMLLSTAASAFVLLSPARTWDNPPNYIVDNRGLVGVNDGNGGEVATRNAIVSSSAWNGAGAGTVVNATVGSVSGFSLGDGVPMLNFQDPQGACGGNCLAATFTGFFSNRGDGTVRINDADIVTNTSHSWTSQGEDPGGSGCSSEFYVEGVMVHEVGHGLGLGHTNVSGATMFPSVSACNNSPASTAADDNNAIVALYGGGGGGGGGAPCTSCTQFTGFLSGANDFEYEPNGTWYQTGSGTHRGWLEGPAGTDFDLRLYRWNGSAWALVASSLSSDSSEFIQFNGSSGFYLWQVRSWSGSGSYNFWLDPP